MVCMLCIILCVMKCGTHSDLVLVLGFVLVVDSTPQSHGLVSVSRHSGLGHYGLGSLEYSTTGTRAAGLNQGS